MLESIYYCSGIVVAVCAVVALIQIIINKHQLETDRKNQKNQLERESQKYAIDQVAYYNNTIIPLENEIDKKRNGNHIECLDNPIISLENNKIMVKTKFTKEDKDKIMEIADKVTAVINALEVYSAVLVSGLANEKFVFQVQGYSYCKTVEQYLSFIINLSEGETQKSTTTKLYYLWKTRLNKEKLTSEKEKIERTLANTEMKEISIIGINDK